VQDAAIFPSVMQILIKRNVAVVMTSNQHPQNLYLGGLNRHLFLPPLLEVLKEECRILNLNAEGTDIDWRSSGNSNDREWSWSTRFDQLSLSPVSISLSPTRSMTLTSCATGGLTTTCTYLTESDLFTDADYLTLAKYLHAKNLGLVLDVCGVAPFKSSDILGRARRFGKLIEVLYDAKVKLEILTEKDHPSELFVSLSYSNKEEEDKKQARASPLAHSAIDEAEKSINRCISRLRQLVTI
jgi:cell division protein ZapE